MPRQDRGVSRDTMVAMSAEVAVRLGTSYIDGDYPDGLVGIPRLPPLGAYLGASVSVAGDDFLGCPTVCARAIPVPADTSYQCDDVDVYCYMGRDAALSARWVRLRGVLGSVEGLLPEGTKMWCRVGDMLWTKVGD